MKDEKLIYAAEITIYFRGNEHNPITVETPYVLDRGTLDDMIVKIKDAMDSSILFGLTTDRETMYIDTSTVVLMKIKIITPNTLEL